MKLIMRYNVEDRYTFSYDVYHPIEYSSPEALICDFEKTINGALYNRLNDWSSATFKFGTESFNTCHFWIDDRIILPEILTIDEWFKKENINP